MLRADITILFSMISSSSSVISCLFSDSVLRLGGDFRRIPVKVEAVSRIVDDSGAVFLRKDTFAANAENSNAIAKPMCFLPDWFLVFHFVVYSDVISHKSMCKDKKKSFCFIFILFFLKMF